MVTVKSLESVFKNRYNLAVGALTLEELKSKIMKTPSAKIKVSGRSYKTGKKMTVTVPIKAFLNF